MIVADSSPLIVLGRLNRLDILAALFGQVYIPTSVYREVAVETKVREQREAIITAIDNEFIIIAEPRTDYPFRRTLYAGEAGVLNLALEKNASRIIIDDRKARNEASELGFELFYTTDILTWPSQNQRGFDLTRKMSV